MFFNKTSCFVHFRLPWDEWKKNNEVAKLLERFAVGTVFHLIISNSKCCLLTNCSPRKLALLIKWSTLSVALKRFMAWLKHVYSTSAIAVNKHEQTVTTMWYRWKQWSVSGVQIPTMSPRPASSINPKSPVPIQTQFFLNLFDRWKKGWNNAGCVRQKRSPRT